MAAGLAAATPARAEPGGLAPFLERLRERALGLTVVLHTGRRTYTGQLLQVDAASICLEAESAEFDERCRLEVDPRRVEAFEIFTS